MKTQPHLYVLHPTFHTATFWYRTSKHARFAPRGIAVLVCGLLAGGGPGSSEFLNEAEDPGLSQLSIQSIKSINLFLKATAKIEKDFGNLFINAIIIILLMQAGRHAYPIC